MSRFDQMMAIVFKNEGGYVSPEDAAAVGDPGGETNLGITEVTLRRLGLPKLAEYGINSLDPEDLTHEQAEALYKGEYWAPVAAYYEKSDPGLALVLFDSGVQHGPGRAIRWLQGAVGAKSDGVFGPNTRAAVAVLPPMWVLLRVCQRRRQLLTRWVQAQSSKRVALLYGVIDRVDQVLETAYQLNSTE